MTPSQTERRAGVIDIGSNSVRLVVFSVRGDALYPTFNEKVMAGLGRGLSETGRLSKPGCDLALAAMTRFRAILTGLDVQQVRAVATAAVREAADGERFARKAAAKAGVELSILSGSDEGRLSAYGVLAGFSRPQGLVCDLGGSSLEVFPVGDGALGAGETHPLGPLALDAVSTENPGQIRKAIRAELSTSTHAAKGAETLYAVGGAWRALAKVAMAETDYPLRVLHGFRLDRQTLQETLDIILANRGSEMLTQIAGRRGAQLHLTGLVLDELVRMTDAKSVVISSYGLREGVVSELMGLTTSTALFDGLAAFANLSADQVAFGEELARFSQPVFAEQPSVFGNWRHESRLHRAAALMANAAGRYHPDHRDHMALDQILYAPVAGLSHADRVFLGLAVASRYRRKFSIPKFLAGFLTEDQIVRARAVGHILRLASIFSGRSTALLAEATLTLDSRSLTLRLPADRDDLISESVSRRLANAAEDFDVAPQVAFQAPVAPA